MYTICNIIETELPMNHVPRSAVVSASVASETELAAQAKAESLRALRAVHRAMGELRRGRPVLLLADLPLVIVPAETAQPESLADLLAVATSKPLLLLGAGRAAVLQGQPAPPDETPVAFTLPDDLLSARVLREVADPTASDGVTPAGAPVLGSAELPQAARGALALLKIARLLPAAVIAEADIASGGAADRMELLRVTEAEALTHASRAASMLSRIAEANVPLEDASDARVVAFRAPDGGVEHLAIVIGKPDLCEAPLVRVHSECFTGDLLGSLRCDCGPQLRAAIRRMAEEGAGVVLYLAQEGRGIGLVNKLRAYALQDRGLDTLDANRALGWAADERNFLAAAIMLDALDVHRIRLLTNNPDKVAALVECGIDVAGREPHALPANGVNDAYLATKAKRFGHFL